MGVEGFWMYWLARWMFSGSSLTEGWLFEGLGWGEGQDDAFLLLPCLKNSEDCTDLNPDSIHTYNQLRDQILVCCLQVHRPAQKGLWDTYKPNQGDWDYIMMVWLRNVYPVSLCNQYYKISDCMWTRVYSPPHLFLLRSYPMCISSWTIPSSLPWNPQRSKNASLTTSQRMVKRGVSCMLCDLEIRSVRGPVMQITVW